MDLHYKIYRQVWRLRGRLKTATAATVVGVYTLTKYCLKCKNLWLSIDEVSCKKFDFSASLGCRYCNFLLNALKHFNLFDDRLLVKLSGRKGRFHLKYWPIELELYTPTGHPPAWHGIAQDANPLDAVLSGSPQTPEAYEFVRSCLRDCDANHPECKTTSQGLPTRLLDVQHEGAQQVILVETESLPAGHSTTYIALSYCWGRRQSLTLKFENLEAMKLGLMVSSLPQTLQDAITVTRALGQQYLWVDALCIIQNSPSDWEVESSKMTSVYRDAYLTIAAATASDVTQGFLSRNYRESNAWYKEPYHEEWINQKACSTILGARLINEEFGHGYDYSKLSVLPWNRRGWTLQERFLSRRLLKYDAYELRWVCQKRSACQCRSDLSCSLLAKDPMDSPTYKLESAQLAHEQWRRIVENYTARRLTDARDKLPAISGLAQVFQQVIQSPYIAGMFENQLPLGLLWSGYSGYAPELYIAPTFSWASISSPIQWSERYWDSLDGWVSQVVVEDTCSIVDGKDPLGRVKDGWIRLRGYIFKAAFIREGHIFSDMVSIKHFGILHIFRDTVLEEFQTANEHGEVERSVRRKRQPSVITPQDDEPSPPEVEDGAVVYLLLMGYKHNTWTTCYFLVLGLSSDKPGMYERLGLVIHRLPLATESRRKIKKTISGLIAAADERKAITIV